MEERGLLYAAALEYLYYRREPDFDAMTTTATVVFKSMKPVFDKQIARKESGRNGGRKKAQNERAKKRGQAGKTLADGKQMPSKPVANGKQTSSKTLANGKQTPTEQEQEQEVKKPSADALGKESGRRFRKPTAAEVDAYIAERGYGGFTGQQFVDHYEANGWMVGRNRMRDWRAAVRTWQSKRSRGMPRGQPRPTLVDFGAYDLRSEEA